MDYLRELFARLLMMPSQPFSASGSRRGWRQSDLMDILISRDWNDLMGPFTQNPAELDRQQVRPVTAVTSTRNAMADLWGLLSELLSFLGPGLEEEVLRTVRGTVAHPAEHLGCLSWQRRSRGCRTTFWGSLD
jgi:hypothetical protein